MAPTEILVVDDEVGIRELLHEILEDEGFVVRLAENAGTARELRRKHNPSLVLLDIWMPDADGVTLLKEWKAAGLLTMPVVMLSGHATIETAVEATRIGAFDFLEKPIGLQKLLSTVQRALKVGQAKRASAINLADLGESQVINELRARLETLVNERRTALLTGEVGVGFIECARALHEPNTPWLVLESGQRLISSPLEILESARGGTLYCPEVAHLSRSEQRSLAFMLGKTGTYGVRIVCASSEPLGQLSGEGRFDPTLFALLSSCTVVIPPLRSRRSDLAGLIERCALAFSPDAPARLSPEVRQLLESAPWPGNLIQLQSVLSSLLLSNNDDITVDHLQAILGDLRDTSAPDRPALPPEFFELPLREAREAFERIYFENLLGRESSNMSRVADKAGLERTHLYRKLKQLNIRFPRRVPAE
ncbi:MAG TPA: response regulator [Casimicrobium huifangae]|nr:response regulator [Casimicrobium huifangae]HOB02436.1 response regulator [Casimicrobium huifangae]HQA34537.1 response regulator [Casimicrobium huifangae]HQD64964.1 response regulator [Casimicrobium huifangae]